MNQPEQTTPPAAAQPSPRQLLQQLQKQFAVFGEHRPLSIGIDKQIIAAMPDVNRKLLRIALAMHTNTTPYLKALQNATHRFDLQGNQAGEVSEEHRTHARTTLNERFKKAAEARKAKAAAEAEAEAQQRRAEKLAQLAAKFSSR